jgi:hypothetical protein
MAVTEHILRLRHIANDIATKVYCKRVVSRYSEEQRDDVFNSIYQDLVDWRRSVPFPLPNLHPRVPQGCMSWYDLNFYTHLTTLYRPSPLFPTLDIARVNILTEAAAMAIRHANSMHLQKRFAFNWLNLLTVYNAVIALVYSVTVQPENLADSLERLRAVEDLELATELFTILGLSEQWLLRLSKGIDSWAEARITGQLEPSSDCSMADQRMFPSNNPLNIAKQPFGCL